jgi:hypothetical protein
MQWQAPFRVWWTIPLKPKDEEPIKRERKSTFKLLDAEVATMSCPVDTPKRIIRPHHCSRCSKSRHPYLSTPLQNLCTPQLLQSYRQKLSPWRVRTQPSQVHSFRHALDAIRETQPQILFRVCLIPRGQCVRTSPKLENGNKYTDTNTLCLSLQSWHFKSVCCRNAHAVLSPYLSYQPPCKLLQIKSTQMKLLSCTIIIMCNDKSRWTVAFIHTLQLTHSLTHSGICLDFAATLLNSCLMARDRVTLCGVKVPFAADHQQVSDRILQLSIPNCTWTSLKGNYYVDNL